MLKRLPEFVPQMKVPWIEPLEVRLEIVNIVQVEGLADPPAFLN